MEQVHQQVHSGPNLMKPLDVIRQQKSLLRTRIRKDLRNFPLQLRKQEDDAIQDHVLSADWFKNSRNICAYISCPGLREVNTSKIIGQILRKDSGQKLYTPRIKDKNSHMQMLHVESHDDLYPNSMQILEPSLLDRLGNARQDVMDATEPVDLVILPGLAFDKLGNRLGRGGGYYDVFLQGLLQRAIEKGWKRPLLVALAYSVQILDEPVPVDFTDVQVDALVSHCGTMMIADHLVK